MNLLRMQSFSTSFTAPELIKSHSLTYVNYLLKVAWDHFRIMDPLNKEPDNSVIGGPGGNNVPADGTGKFGGVLCKTVTDCRRCRTTRSLAFTI